MFKKISILLASVLISFFASAQQAKVRGSFLADSVRIGEAIPYSLTAYHSKKTDVLFPDSSFSFAPFEFRSKRFFPTVTKDTISYDSVVYYLSTYEVQPVQHLSLPVFIVHPQDCTRSVAQADSMRVVQTIKALPDSISLRSLHLKTNTAYQKVKWSFNYIILLIIAGVLIIIGLVGWIVFGTEIRKHFAVRRLEKNHLAFITQFDLAVEQLKTNVSAVRTEAVLLIWKKYMEGLVERPFTKSTTKEILRYDASEQLSVALRATDRIIYGGLNEFSETSFSTLHDYAITQYQRKMEEVKNG